MGKKREKVEVGKSRSFKAHEVGQGSNGLGFKWSIKIGTTPVEARLSGKKGGYVASLHVGKDEYEDEICVETFSKAKFALCFLMDQIQHYSDHWERDRSIAKRLCKNTKYGSFGKIWDAGKSA